MTNEVKQEASLPVQSRIDIRTLVNLVEYWEGEGVMIRSMSQLISWTVELAQHLLSLNNKLPFVTESVTEANRYLMDKRLYQPGLRKKGHAKVFQAMMFENMRTEGVDPSTYVKHQHSVLHNPHSIRPPEFSEPTTAGKAISDEIWNKTQKRIREEEEKEKANKKLDNSPIVKVEALKSGNEDAIDAMLKAAEARIAQNEIDEPVKKKSDTPRAATKEELDTRLLEREREDRIQQERYKTM